MIDRAFSVSAVPFGLDRTVRAAALVLAVPLLLGVAVTAAPHPAAAQTPVEGIAAVVNDEAVSMSDVDNRLQLALLASGLPRTEETRDRLLPQVLRGLIDERLQRQEAARLGVQVAEAEVDEAFAGIAQQNGLTAAQFEQALRRGGVSPSTLRDQIRAQLAWRGVVRQRIVPTVQIPDAAVDEEIRRFEENQGLPEYRVSEIFLSVDTPGEEPEVRRFAEDLVRQIRAGGDFAALARQFSQGGGAAGGGDLGWVLQGSLAPELDRALQSLSPGQVSQPIRTVSGFHILRVADRRSANVVGPLDAQVVLGQLATRFTGGSGAAVAALRNATAGMTSCDAMEAAAPDIPAGYNESPRRPLRAFSPQIQEVARDLPVGVPSEPQVGGGQAVVLMVCARQSAEDATDPETIRAQLGEERVDLLQRRYLRDLRDAAFIDTRI
jgi:peptidyl-prolyl cis-trans isomerase SurA